MRILIDTNVFIPLEPSSPEDVESGGDRATALARHASVEDVQLLVHPDSLVDIGRDQRTDRQRLRRALFEKYVSLEAPPEITPEMEAVVGPSKRGGNHWVDNRLLAAVSADAVSLLVTEDRGIHQKARRLGIHERVLTTDDATSLLESLTEQPARPLPLVSDVPTHVISTSDPILQSLRADYPGFDKWFSGIRQEARRAFVIRDSSQRCAALCIRKPDDDQYGLGGKPLKLSTFKVGESYAGNRFGELLLKAVFEWASNNAYNLIWLSVFEHHEVLVSMLDDFGFEPTGHRTDRGELVLAKRLLGDTTEQVPDPFEHHRLHGPPSLCLGQEADYLVPIQPQFHRMLFPELEGEVQEWLTGQRRLELHVDLVAPFGNAIRKAYLSNARTRSLQPGNILYFYRSQDLRAVTTVGVVENTLVSESVEEIAAFVGSRTVYSLQQIRELAQGPVLSILFRQDRHLSAPIFATELVDNFVAGRAPQQISAIRPEGSQWIRAQVTER